MYTNDLKGELKFQLDNACRNLSNTLADVYAVERKEQEFSETIRSRREFNSYWDKKMAKRLKEQQAIRKNRALHAAYLAELEA